MQDEKDMSLSSRVWFTVRWYTGFVIDICITVGGIAASLWLFEKMFGNTPISLPATFYKLPFVQFSMVISLLSMAMAGRQWARTQYFTHVLPEVWNDTVQNFLKNAKKDEDKDE
jgi:hypothetical protein